MPAAEQFHVQITASGSSSVKREAAESNGALNSVGKTAGAVASRVGVLAKVVGIASVALGVVAVKAAIDFNQQMTLVHTQAGASAAEVAKLRGEVLELAKHSEFGPSTLAQGLFRVESAGFRGARAMSVLKSASDLAAVGQSDLESTTYALTAAINSGIKGTESASKTVGTLNAAIGLGNMRMEDLVGALSTGILPAANAFGLSLTDVTSALDLMTRSGTPAQAAATRLRMTFSLMGAPTSQAATALGSIGLKSTQLAEDMRKPNGLLIAVQDLRKHLDESGLSAVQQAQVITQAFGGGRSSAAILTMTQQVGTLANIYGDGAVAAGKFGEAVKAQAETPAAKFKTAWSSVQVSLVELGSHIMPMVAAEATKLGDIIGDPKLSPGDKLGAIATELGHVFAQLAPEAAKAGVALGGGLVQGIVTGMLHNSLLTDVFTGALLIRMVGGKAALIAAGRLLGRYYGIGIAAGTTETAAAGAAASGGAAALAGGAGAAAATRGGAAAGADMFGVNAARSRAAGATAAEGFAAGAAARLKAVNWGRIAKTAGFVALADAAVSSFKVGWDNSVGNRLVGGGHANLLANVTSSQGQAAIRDTGITMGRTLGINFGHTSGENFSKEFQRELQAASANISDKSFGSIFGSTLSNLTPDEKGIARATDMAARTMVRLMGDSLHHQKVTRAQQIDMSEFIRKDPNAANEIVQQIQGAVGTLGSGALANMKDIRQVAARANQGVQRALQAGLGQDAGRALQANITRSTAGAITKGMQNGAIPATKRNLRIVRNLYQDALLLRGADPLGLAKTFARGWSKAGTISHQNIGSAIRDLKMMPPAARQQAGSAMLLWAQELEQKGKIPLSRLRDLQSKFAAQLKIFPVNAKNAGIQIASAFSPMVPAIGSILSVVKDNVNTALKGMGSHNVVSFSQKFLSDNFSWLTKQRGGFLGTVPGEGSGDKVPYHVLTEPGEGLFVMNRNAMGELQKHNDRYPRFAGGGQVPSGKIVVGGPAGGMRYDLQGGADTAMAAANKLLAKTFRENQQGSGPGGASFGPKGVGSYHGIAMANWVVSALQYAAQHGSGDPAPTSGYRPGFDTHTATGASEHQGTQYPHGAVDFGGMVDPPALPKKMAVVNANRGFRTRLIAPIGFRDDGHASGTGHQVGGIVALKKGGAGKKGKGGGKPPVMLLFHPGGFIFGGGGSMPDAAAEATARGFEPRYIDYPLGNVPAAVGAARTAARTAGKGGRPVVAYGESAGGLLASLLAERGLVKAAATQNPVSNIPEWLANTGSSDVEGLMTKLGLTPQSALAYSPDQHGSKAPQFVESGAADVTVGSAQAWANSTKKIKGVTLPGAHLENSPARMHRAMAYLSRQRKRQGFQRGGYEHLVNGGIVKRWARVLADTKAPKPAGVALYAAGLDESGIEDLSYGDGTSEGPLQETSETAGGTGVGQHDIAGLARYFLTHGFYNRGGAISLAHQGMSPANIATNVQGNRDGASVYRPFVGRALGILHGTGLRYHGDDFWRFGKDAKGKKKHKKVKGADVGFVLPPKYQGPIDKWTAAADIAGERADRAATLDGAVLGRNEMSWLQEELDSLFNLRNAVAVAMAWLQDQIKALNKEIARAVAGKDHDPKGKKKKKKKGKKPKGAVGHGTPKQMRDLVSQMTDAKGTLTDTLSNVQGLGGPTGVLPGLPPIDALGGQIFDTRNQMRELTDGKDDGSVSTSDGESAALLRQLLDNANARNLVLSRQYPTLSRIPGLIGAYAGGRSGGREGWALLGENGPEIAKLANGGPVVNAPNTRAFEQLVQETGTGAGGPGGSDVQLLEPHLHLHGDLHTDGRSLEDAVTLEFKNQTRKAASVARRRTRP